MSEEAVKKALVNCISIEYLRWGNDLSMMPSGTLTINNWESFQLVMNSLEEDNQINSLNLLHLEGVTIENLKKCKNLCSLSMPGTLDLQTLYQLYHYFPNIQSLYYQTVEESVLDVVDKFPFQILTEDPKFALNNNNPYFEWETKLTIKVLPKLQLTTPIQMPYLNELAQHCQKINLLIFKNNNLKEITDVIKSLKAQGIQLKKVILQLVNQHYDNVEQLKELDEMNLEVIIQYDPNADFDNCSIDQFITMRKTIEYYVHLIKTANLSLVEQVMYAYDLMKSYAYQETENKEISRTLHGVITTGNIVCVGYARMLSQILNELGIKTIDDSVLTDIENEKQRFEIHRTNHMRNFIRIDDDLYQLHGIYCMDVTWDSNTQSAEGLYGYEYFLIPFPKYEMIFEKNSYPPFLSYLLGKIELTKSAQQNILHLFQGTNEKIEQYIKARPLKEEEFARILTNVRLAQGYPKEMISEELNKAVFPVKEPKQSQKAS